VTWGTFEFIFEIEERILIYGFHFDGSWLVATECGTADQKSNGNDAEDNQYGITVELHLLLSNIFLIKCVKDTTLVSL